MSLGQALVDYAERRKSLYIYIRHGRMEKVNVMTQGNPGMGLTDLEPGGKVHEECTLGVCQ